jgi:hypothetical protein
MLYIYIDELGENDKVIFIPSNTIALIEPMYEFIVVKNLEIMCSQGRR